MDPGFLDVRGLWEQVVLWGSLSWATLRHEAELASAAAPKGPELPRHRVSLGRAEVLLASSL